MKNIKFYILALVLSMLLFFAKGITYAVIGSYIPLALSCICLILLFIALKKRTKGWFFFIRFWAIAVLVWGFIRIAIAIIIHFTTEISENHVNEQFDLLGNIVSLLAIFVGIYLLTLKRQRFIASY